MNDNDKEIAELCRKLLQILEDSEYGLGTWHMARYTIARQLHAKLAEVLSG